MIVDASIAVKWIAHEPDSDAALTLIERGDLVAPALMLMEVANALYKMAVRGEVSATTSFAQNVAALANIVEIIEDAPLAARALDIALALRHPVYDCIYLALAEARDDVVIAADKRLFTKVLGTPFAARLRGLPTQ